MDAQIKHIDRCYRDQRGQLVHVIAWDASRRRVIFRRAGYAYECMQPLEQFQRKFTRTDDAAWRRQEGL
ncbi:DUF4222 domain-containing protein [Mixta calida]|uniref:DUF4222 domain-containing protein n=1 Tax=Mixta calida TaxID=665913 RepID=UPI0034D75376